MRKRLFALTCVALTAMLVTPTSARLGAQSRSKSTPGWTTPRTAEGHPDLQGVWFFGRLTPLERPAKLAGRTHLTDEEIADIEERTADAAVRNATFGFFGDTSKYAYDKRTSLIVDPADGKMPPFTPFGRERSIAHITRISRVPNGPEDRSVWDRCILGWNSGPPMIPTVPAGYNQNVQLFQTRDYFVILNEQVHNARIVPLDGRPHGALRQWAGDSRGRWEGQTLVVDSVNFTPFGTGTITINSSLRVVFDEHLHLTERFTRVREDTVLYEFTIDDPTIWTRPWTVAVPLTKTQSNLYEYACHEGNYTMKNSLSAARAEEASGKTEACYSFNYDCEEVKKFEEAARKASQGPPR
jgi:hypothetical protein